ncbi:carboxypeptidase C [Aspergillus homomorphus CBS 101889]|uniref:Carboxypeptidase n=1 Tax=Aspergillus homomorphus (strain CBS 101889) TaxID=1450537 RepID=A0A395I7I8_ASPHC|nr:carboxypeptidase C [Aspergillus homomorphus CBS 101889]RAL15905.1 carboxypeptidase C [Aspergillus homomorphus CBS 101889]
MVMLTSLALTSLLGLASAQFPPKLEGVTVIQSQLHENVTISYKEPGICETTPGVRSYSGYVHLPPGFLNATDTGGQDYPINTFFWFFEARKDPGNAPLAIWLNGGPGGSSLMGLFEELGPCTVADDGTTTILNPWSWNNEVNLLFLDQPVQVGFSYDVPTNGTLVSLENGEAGGIIPGDFSTEIPESNFTSLVGTFASQKLNQTADTTAHAAPALWQFLQTWFFEFPHYRPNDDRISLWAESYGGHYGPEFFRFILQQNERVAEGTAESGARHLHLDTLGIVNGYIDSIVQGESFIHWGYNNTYGIEIFNQSTYEALLDHWRRPGGCRDRLVHCQAALKDRDAGTSPAPNITELCAGIEQGCEGGAPQLYLNELNHSWYDIAHPKHDPFPGRSWLGYLTQESVLGALGVPVNFTAASPTVDRTFVDTVDLDLGGFLESIAYLLDSGVKVHMMYGDRDWTCNWVGGEAASLAVPYSRQADFAEAGYTPLFTAEGIKGMTRQLGNYSFTRVFQAGHEVPSYQPLAAHDIFRRATFNLDIPSGLLDVSDELRTVGLNDTSGIRNVRPAVPEPRCYILSPGTCEPEVWKTVLDGTAVVKNWIVIGVEDEESVLEDGRSQVVLGGTA